MFAAETDECFKLSGVQFAVEKLWGYIPTTSPSHPFLSSLLLCPPLCPLEAGRWLGSFPDTFENSTLLQVSLSEFSEKENWFIVSGSVVRNCWKLTLLIIKLFLLTYSLLPVKWSTSLHIVISWKLRLFNNFACSIDNNRISAFLFLDMSTAFDTVDQIILLSVLEKRFAI